MKLRLPIVLRLCLLISQALPAAAALTWSGGDWNYTDPSWLDSGASMVFSPGDSVEFTTAAAEKLVTITEAVEPGSIVVSASGYQFTGSGTITGSGALSIQQGGSLLISISNSFTGGTQVEEGASLRLALYDSVGTPSTSERALGSISGAGTVEISFLNEGTQASIQGNSWAGFTGDLYVEQGTIGLGRIPNHSGPGGNVQINADCLEIGSDGKLVTTYSGGTASLSTGNVLSSDIRTENGSVIGNRDGHINWTGDVYLNMADVTAQTPVYQSAAETEMSLYYGKYVVWDGVVRGEGTLRLTAGVPDLSTDHRLVLTNSANTFSGTYQVAGNYLSTLALASADAASTSSVELQSANARLVLMASDAAIQALNGTQGVVQAEGTGDWTLSVTSGDYSGIIRDAGTPTAGLSLGILKVGNGELLLSGPSCSYTGTTTVNGGSIQYSGDASLASIDMAGNGAVLQTGGNLSLQSGAGLSFNLENTSGASVEIGGDFQLAESTCPVQLRGYENLAVGSYPLMRWSGSSSAVDETFFLTGVSATDSLVYSLSVQENALQLQVKSLNDVPWLWSGESATWSDDSSAQWSNASAGGPAGQSVTFSLLDAGTVTINRVTPAAVEVIGGEYTFISAGPDAAGVVSSGNLTISGQDTVLNLNLANPQLTGATYLQGGTLVLGDAAALGESALHFNGGLLRYAPGVTQDMSTAVSPASTATVRVDTNGNNVSWSSTAGVMQALRSGVEKQGAGELALSWVAAGETITSELNIIEGSLSLSKTSGQGILLGRFSGTGTLSLNSPSGQLTVRGDNTGFGGTIELTGDGSSTGGSVSFATGDALGGSSTLVRVMGQRFWFGSNTRTLANLEIVSGYSTILDGSTGGRYVFSGSVSGGGELSLNPSSHIEMPGNLSDFTGAFRHPGSTTVGWLLGGANVVGNGILQCELNGAGSGITYTIWYSGETTFSGAVTGQAGLRQRGSGTLILTGENTTTGTLQIDESCEAQLGSATQTGLWSGNTLSGNGTFTLVNGALATPLTSISGTLLADVAAGAQVDMGGMSGDALQRITIGAGGQLSGLAGDLNIGSGAGVASLELTPGSANVGAAPIPADGAQYMIEQGSGQLLIHDSATVTLDMETIRSLIQGKRQAVYIHITSGSISLLNGITADDLFSNSATTPAALGLVVLGVEGGNIVLEGAVRDVYMVTENGDYPTVTTYDRLQPYLATFVDAGYELSLQLPGNNAQQAWVNNLLGPGDFSVANSEPASGIVRVLLNNAVLGAVDGDLTPGEEMQINTANTELQGNITAGQGVQLVKTGSGTFTLGGQLEADWFEIDEGTVRLQGSGSRINTLHGMGSLQLEAGSSLEINADSLGFTGELSGSGTLVLNGTMRGAGSVGALNGSGSMLSDGATFEVMNTRNSIFSGSLMAGTSPGLLQVDAGTGSFTMQRVQGASAWSVQNRGALVLDQSGESANATLTLGSLRLLDGSITTIVLNTDIDMQVFHFSSLKVEDGAAVTLQSTGGQRLETAGDGTVVLGRVADAQLGADALVPLNLAGATPFSGIESAWLTVEQGRLVLHVLRSEVNGYRSLAHSHNARAGAGMLWHLPNQVLNAAPDLREVTAALNAMLDSGRKEGADRLLSAVAGAGTAVLGAAVMGDIERQLKAIRNRTTSMGVDSGTVPDEMPLLNAWIHAEGDRSELDADGTAAGYTLSTWGGTVGCDADVSSCWTVGLALTAMYGDLQGESPDHAEGDANTFYLSLFARYAARRWTHTLVAAAGLADISLKRHLYYPGGSYRTRGETNGVMAGLLYEVGYVIPLDEDNQACIQPIANLSYRHASVDSYREHGSDAALRVGSQRMNVLTIGLGARAQTYALESTYNRSCLLEARALLKLDAGDRRSSDSVELLAAPTRRGHLRSADTGRVGMELGAGITVPIGVDAGSLFLDAGFEMRSEQTELNAVLGYRVNF